MRLGFLAIILALGVADVARSQERGPVTNLPLPRFVSLKADEGNARRGPSLTHRVDWVFTYQNQPLKVVAEYGNWRRVQDYEGQGGWMHYSLLSGVRWVRVQEDRIPVRFKPNEAAATRAFAERGVLARLGACVADWCEISAQGESGWVLKTQIWGVDPDELRD